MHTNDHDINSIMSEEYHSFTKLAATPQPGPSGHWVQVGQVLGPAAAEDTRLGELCLESFNIMFDFET